jgi:hypothetical protein
MTKITLYPLMGWAVSGAMIGYGLGLMPLPPVGVAMIAGGLAGLLITARIFSVGITLLAAIVALSPSIMPNLPVWAALFISVVILLVIIDQIVRSN